MKINSLNNNYYNVKQPSKIAFTSNFKFAESIAKNTSPNSSLKSVTLSIILLTALIKFVLCIKNNINETHAKKELCKLYNVEPDTKDYNNSIIKTYEELVGKGNLSKMLKTMNAQENFEMNNFTSNKNKNNSYSNAYKIAKIVQDMKTEFPENIHSEITSAAKDFINVKKSIKTPKMTLAIGELNPANIKEHMLNKQGFYLHGDYDNDNLVKVYFSYNGVEQPLDFKNINYEDFLNSKINEIYVSKNA